MGPGGQTGQGGAAGVGEEIQNLKGSVGIFGFRFLYNRRKPVPVYRLFGKKSGMLEAERLQSESKLSVTDAPFLRQIKKLPFPAAFGAAVIVSVFLFPVFVSPWHIPYDLRVRAHQIKIAPAFQFFSFGTVYYFIILPVVCDPHFLFPLFFQ